jgi:hypothetical protein
MSTPTQAHWIMWRISSCTLDPLQLLVAVAVTVQLGVVAARHLACTCGW